MENVICPNCGKIIDIQDSISREEFDGQVRCWKGCHLLWNIVIREETLVSINLEEILYPAIEATNGRYN